jgi:putative ABC transport system permease protein
MTVAARVEGDPLALNRQISAAVAAVDPIQATSFFTTLEQSLRNALGIQRITAALTAAFAGVALLLSALGLYSVLAYAVTQRTGEIGIRVALGAQKNQVIGLILSQGMRLVLLGLVAGLGLAAALSRFIRSLLYQVEPLDPLVFAAVPVLFVLVALIACLAPSLRASGVDPLVALRTE